MFYVKLDEEVYKLTFQYDTERILISGQMVKCPRTIASLRKGDKLVAQGKALCGPKDKFERYHGKRVALTRMLKDNPVLLNKEKRTIIWNEYNTLSPIRYTKIVYGKKSFQTFNERTSSEKVQV